MLTLRPITEADNAAAARVIRTVMPEFSCVGAGFSINDPEVDNLHEAYAAPRSAFYVLEDTDGRVVGVGGYAPLTGGDGNVCELRKMYLLPAARGHGGGRALIERCLAGAAADGFTLMYLETVQGMTDAARLYHKYGFRYLDGPLGATGHGGCDRFMVRELAVPA